VFQKHWPVVKHDEIGTSVEMVCKLSPRIFAGNEHLIISLAFIIKSPFLYANINGVDI
jgi:hypothetical protein